MSQGYNIRPAQLDASLTAACSRLIEERFGLRLSANQTRRLDHELAQLVSATAFAEPKELLRTLAAGWRPDLLECLVGELTNGETHFFRVGPHIDALRRIVLPELVRRRADERRLRLWSAGCSTGEEPFTLAILLREQLPAPDEWSVDLVASDITRAALDAAQRGTYGEWSFRDTPDEVRERYFTREGRSWQLAERVRGMVRFTRVNLLVDAYPGAERGPAELDIIMCRNVTIYFSPEATQRVYRRFVDSLSPGGWLVLGPSDPSPLELGSLEPVFAPGAVLWRKQSDDTRPSASHVLAQAPYPVVVAPRRSGRAASAHHAPTRHPVPEPLVLESARERAEHSAVASPLSGEAHLQLGMLYLDQGDHGEALASLRRAVFLEPRDPLAQFTLGRAWIQSGDPNRAHVALVHARRLLSGVLDDTHVSGGAQLPAGELLHAIQVQLGALHDKRAA